MLKTLDILIGVATVMLLFSMAVTIVTQFVANLLQSRGKNLLQGLTGLLKQIDPNLPAEAANKIAETVLKHPLVAEANGKLGEVIHREEFTTLLMGLAAGEGAATLDAVTKKAVEDLLAKNGVADPAGTLKNIRSAALALEASNPELANDVRHRIAILQEARSQFVAKVHGWFDQTIDRVSARFTVTARVITFIAALIVAVTVQLDTFALVDRLSVDDKFRDAVTQGAKDVVDEAQKAAANSSATAPAKTPDANASAGAATPTATASPTPTATATPSPTNTPASGAGTTTSPAPTASNQSANQTPATSLSSSEVQKRYYTLLSSAGLITLPTDWQTWVNNWTLAKIPGILLSALLLSLGAPFWYARLQDLLKLRSTVAQNDANQRQARQTTQTPASGDDSSGAPTTLVRVAAVGEQGDPNAVG